MKWEAEGRMHHKEEFNEKIKEIRGARKDL